MKVLSILCAGSLLCSGGLSGMDMDLVSARTENTQLINFAHKMYNIAFNGAIGFVAGAARTVVNQPLVYFKNTLQTGNPIEWRRPSVFYRGLSTNIAAMGPLTAFQTATNAALNFVIPEKSANTALLKGFMAGVFSTVLCAPISLVVLDQQKNNQTIVQTVQRIVQDAGPRAMMRGGVATAVREGCLSVTYLAGFPLVYAAIKKNNPAHSDLANMGFYGGTGMLMGIAVALFTHPCDTVKTVMQADYKGREVKGIRSAIQTIYDRRGLKGFFSGAVPRAFSYGTAVPLMSLIAMLLSQK